MVIRFNGDNTTLFAVRIIQMFMCTTFTTLQGLLIKFYAYGNPPPSSFVYNTDQGRGF